MAKFNLGSAMNIRSLTALEILSKSGNFQLLSGQEFKSGPNGPNKYNAVVFNLNEGSKGTGKQPVIAEEFPGVVEALRRARDAGFDRATQPDDYRTAGQIVEDSICLVAVERDPATGNEKVSSDPELEPTHVQFRCYSKQGAKPARVPIGEFDDVLAALENAVEKIPASLEQLAEAEAETETETPDGDTDGDTGGEEPNDTE